MTVRTRRRHPTLLRSPSPLAAHSSQRTHLHDREEGGVEVVRLRVVGVHDRHLKVVMVAMVVSGDKGGGGGNGGKW